MSESRLEIDNQEYQTYLSELGKGWVGVRGFQGPRDFQGPKGWVWICTWLAASADEVLLNVLGARTK
jgi:hypothetical protein